MCVSLCSACYYTSTDTLLLTVWSGSMLTWHLYRRWDINKQGLSKSKLPTERCGVGKLYPGKWSFLSHLLWLFLSWSFFKNHVCFFFTVPDHQIHQWHRIIRWDIIQSYVWMDELNLKNKKEQNANLESLQFSGHLLSVTVWLAREWIPIIPPPHMSPLPSPPLPHP